MDSFIRRHLTDIGKHPPFTRQCAGLKLDTKVNFKKSFHQRLYSIIEQISLVASLITQLLVNANVQMLKLIKFS